MSLVVLQVRAGDVSSRWAVIGFVRCVDDIYDITGERAPMTGNPGRRSSMPAKNRRQQKALAAKYGWTWVQDHGFDVVNAQVYENNRAMRAADEPSKHQRTKRRRHHSQ